MEIEMKDMEDDKLKILTPQGLESGDKPQRMRLKKRTDCIRCGECCTGGGPTLLKEDLSLFISGVLSYDNTYTIREGELVRSYGDGEPYESFMELVKVKGKNKGKVCIFYEGEGTCRIYENRPSQCRAYKCWSPESPQGLEENRLDRGELFNSSNLLLDIIDKHEQKCPYKRLSDAIERLSQGEENAVEDIIDMLQYDTYARPFLEERLSIPAAAMDLILGRPLIETINEFGFKVIRDGDEYILLPIKDYTD
jgi:Fe-S-cluster containining protein